MKNLEANFSLPLHSKVKKKKKSTFTSVPIAEEIPEKTKIFHFNCYSKIDCNLFFQMDSKLQISIRIKVVTK